MKKNDTRAMPAEVTEIYDQLAESLDVTIVVGRDPDNPALWRFGLYYNQAHTSRPAAPRLSLNIIDRSMKNGVETDKIEMTTGDSLHFRVPAPRQSPRSTTQI